MFKRHAHDATGERLDDVWYIDGCVRKYHGCDVIVIDVGDIVGIAHVVP